MDHRKFGKIVKSLREEHMDYATGSTWTQKKLAEEANLSEQIVGKIEQGRRVNLYGEDLVLVKLANALKLSHLERREFFAASAELEQMVTTVDSSSTENLYDQIWTTFSKMQLPAYLINPLYDLIGINNSMMSFHGFGTENFQKNDLSTNYNLLVWLFEDRVRHKILLNDGWELMIKSSLYHYRAVALRYRCIQHFNNLLYFLYKQSGFTQLWMQIKDEINNFDGQLSTLIHHHSKFGLVHYTKTVIPISTYLGFLYMIVYVPSDRRTGNLFSDLNHQHLGVQCLLPRTNWEIIA